jgi:hypothetical protein
METLSAAYEWIAARLLEGAFTAALLAVLAYSCKGLIGGHLSGAIDVYYKKQLEEHKARLRYRTEALLDLQRSERDLVIKEYLSLLANLHAKRVEIVAEVYGKLRNYLSAVRRLVREHRPTGTSLKQDVDSVLNAMDDFTSYSLSREVFFPAELSEKIRKMDTVLWATSEEFKLVVEPEKDQEIQVRKWQTVCRKLEEQAQPLFEDLAEEFRRIVGVIPTTQEDSEPNHSGQGG